MKKEARQIKVLKDFDGLNPVQIATITRMVQRSGTRDQKGRPQQVRHWVSYQGQNHSVFVLPNLGECISIDSWDWRA